MKRIAIVGVEQTVHGERLSDTTRGLIYQVCRSLLERVGLRKERLGTIVTASSDYWQGMGCSNVYHYEAAASYLKDSPKVEGDSCLAFTYACLRLLSGHCTTALVAAVTKCSEVPSIPALTRISCDPLYQRPVGLEEQAAAGLQARLYMERHEVSEEEIARVACKSVRNAIFNPHAHRKADLTVEEVLASEIVADPLRAWECAPRSDGACAVLLAEEREAKKLCPTPVWVRGFGWSTESYALGERDLLRPRALGEAAGKAYAMAGIHEPCAEIQAAEITAPYAHQELLWYEGLGLCGPGEGKEFLTRTDINGRLPVNPSGGVLSTNPYVARGLVRVAEAALQVMGRAEARQIPHVRTALAHGTYGLAGQSHTVIILGR